MASAIDGCPAHALIRLEGVWRSCAATWSHHAAESSRRAGDAAGDSPRP